MRSFSSKIIWKNSKNSKNKCLRQVLSNNEQIIHYAMWWPTTWVGAINILAQDRREAYSIITNMAHNIFHDTEQWTLGLSSKATLFVDMSLKNPDIDDS